MKRTLVILIVGAIASVATIAQAASFRLTVKS